MNEKEFEGDLASENFQNLSEVIGYLYIFHIMNFIFRDV